MTKIIVYDALAALAAGGGDVMAALNVLNPQKENSKCHKVIGVDKNNSDIHAARMVAVVGALIRGSIFAVQQGISSNPILQGSEFVRDS
jgi:hypothetical protein